MFKLFKVPGALPYIVVVFLNAFVDLGHKIIIQNTVFKVYDGSTQVILTAIVNGLILLPFILLFSPAGYIADRYAKDKVMQFAAWAAVVITLGITICYYLGWFWPAFGLTFLLAVQSAIYSPAKYGYIKHLFGKEHLAEANGLVQSVTIIAIILGTFAFSILFEILFVPDSNTNNGLIAIAPIGWLLVVNSIFELIMAYRLPILDQGEKQQGFSYANAMSGKAIKNNIQPLIRNKIIRLSVIGLSVFWSVGQILLAAFPAFAKESLMITNTIVIQGVLAATGIGIGLGSFLAGKWSKGHIETGLIPLGAAGISLGLILLPQLNSTTAHFFNLLFIGTMGGLFIVPLNALIQFSARDNELGKVIAGNNLFQNISMLSFLMLTVAFALIGFKTQWLLIMTAIIATIGGLYTIYQLPQSLIRIILTAVMTRRYKVHIQGIKNMPSSGGVLLLGNHISWIDWAIIQIASPRPIRFVMLKSIYERWYLKGFFKLVGCIPIESGASSKGSLATVAKLLDSGEVVCLFPEGAISRNSHLGEFRRGFERACTLTTTDVKIVPFYLRGLWGSQFSRSSEKVKRISGNNLYRDIIVSFGESLTKNTTNDLLKRRVFDLSISSWQQYANNLPSIPHAWIDTVKRVAGEMAIADTQGLANRHITLSATQTFIAATAFSKRIKTISPEQNIGLLLPTSAAGALANMATLLLGKTVVNLNFSANEKAIQSAITQAEIKTVYSSKLFIKKLARKGIDLTDALDGIKIIYMEDLKTSIGRFEMASRWLMIRCLPARLLRIIYCASNDANNTAAILFSSGSEGMPKGVMLSHKNIMANLKQISNVLNVQSDDVMIASLPLFHAFGLTVNQFLPLIQGLPMICHPDPTDVVGTAKAIAKFRVTIMCGTSTFLRLYTKNSKVHPLMLDSLRVVISGAEKLNHEISQNFQLKFNKPVYEGYGATETTPVASANLPDTLDSQFWQVQIGCKPGSVGMPLPGTSFRVVDPDTEQELPTDQDGMIMIGGAQVMQSYLKNPEKTAAVIREFNGQRWYITGDKGHIDKDGFLTIIDRYSRFAKIGGEMIGLGAIEEQIQQLLEQLTPENDDIEITATTIADNKKGEAIAILSTKALDQTELTQQLKIHGCSPLSIPKYFLTVETIPTLGSGKRDFSQIKQLASSMIKQDYS